MLFCWDSVHAIHSRVFKRWWYAFDNKFLSPPRKHDICDCLILWRIEGKIIQCCYIPQLYIVYYIIYITLH